MSMGFMSVGYDALYAAITKASELKSDGATTGFKYLASDMSMCCNPNVWAGTLMESAN